MKKKMRFESTYEAFMARYFSTFLYAFFLSLFSAACTISLMASTHFKSYPERGRYTIIVGLSVSTILTICNYLVVRGRPRAVWGVAILNLLCLFLVLSLTRDKPHFISYVTGILFPLLSLLALNSKRHREMRSALVTIRQQREERHRFRKHR